MTDATQQACELYRKLHAQSPNIVALSDDGLVRIVGDEIDCIVQALAARERAVWLEAAELWEQMESDDVLTCYQRLDALRARAQVKP